METSSKIKAVNVAVIVAHPDDETLWAGGILLMRREWQVFIACLSRKNDPDRAPKFHRLLNELKANGEMGDLDDSPEQSPLPDAVVEDEILSLLPQRRFDLVLTHSPAGEYTRHRRHEETSLAVIRLWHDGRIQTPQLWTFAYADAARSHYPRAITDANKYMILDERAWQRKYELITQVYGFPPDGWEALTTPKTEAFNVFSNAEEAISHFSKYSL